MLCEIFGVDSRFVVEIDFIDYFFVKFIIVDVDFTFEHYVIALYQPADEVDADESKKGHHADHKFAEVIAQKTEAVSEFAKKKSYREQRQYLPIFAVRNEV